MKSLEQSQQVLENEKAELTNKITDLSKEKENLTKEKENLAKEKDNLTTDLSNAKSQVIQANQEKDKLADKNKELDAQVGLLKGQIKSLEQSQQALKNEKDELLREKDNLTTEKDNLTKEKTELTEKNQKLTTEKAELEQKHAPYKKLERLYEVFLEVKGCLNYGFVEKTHSAVDLIASVLGDSKYYLEELYKKASQELSDKKSDKGEKLAELFDLLFEYVKDNKFERLKEPSAYDSTCKKLYPEQNTSQKMQRVVLIGYTYDKKTTYYTIVDMGS
ncbi:hypothetical protein [Helicobacter pylori]|uniref:hypothetical protein n=1 Tax=Helicobacter pylori TaxID=210 RepID=UPI0009AD7EE4